MATVTPTIYVMWSDKEVVHQVGRAAVASGDVIATGMKEVWYINPIGESAIGTVSVSISGGNVTVTHDATGSVAVRYHAVGR